VSWVSAGFTTCLLLRLSEDGIDGEGLSGIDVFVIRIVVGASPLQLAHINTISRNKISQIQRFEIIYQFPPSSVQMRTFLGIESPYSILSTLSSSEVSFLLSR
jgi:hypothetical protein